MSTKPKTRKAKKRAVYFTDTTTLHRIKDGEAYRWSSDIGSWVVAGYLHVHPESQVSSLFPEAFKKD